MATCFGSIFCCRAYICDFLRHRIGVEISDFRNVFDVFLVVSSIADLALTWANIEGGAARNLTILRFARLLKFVRVMRMFRMMKLFSSLRILVGTIYSSFRALIWSMVLLGLFIVVS